MIQVNIHEAKANLSKYIQKACRGQEVFISNRNIPVIELKPVEIKPDTRQSWNENFFTKVIGGWKGSKFILDRDTFITEDEDEIFA